MAKYVIKDNDGNYKKICEDTESRDHWISRYADCISYEEISDADYVELQKNHKKFTSTNPLNTTLIDSTDEDWEYTQEVIQERLTRLIDLLDQWNKTTDTPPSIWATNLTTLKAIDLNSLSYPITGKSWLDCLIKNSISVPSSMEF
jgi:hypothetical protein